MGGLEAEDLIHDVVVRHLPLARSLAARYRGRGEPLEDLVQVARIGLLQAARRYSAHDHDSYIKFAVPTALGELRRYFRDYAWTIKPPRQLQELRPRVVDAQERLMQQMGRQPRLGEIADFLGEDVRLVSESLSLVRAHRPDSLNGALSHPHDQWGDALADAEAFSAVDDRVALTPVWKSLPARTRQVLVLRYVDGMSQQDIGHAVGVSQVQAGRILGQGLDQIRRAVDIPA